MRINNIPVRYAGQFSGANYAPAYPGEHVELFTSLYEAEEFVRDLPMNDGVSLLLWKVSVHDSHGEVVGATRTDAAHADYLIEVGPYGGIRRERL